MRRAIAVATALEQQAAQFTAQQTAQGAARQHSRPDRSGRVTFVQNPPFSEQEEISAGPLSFPPFVIQDEEPDDFFSEDGEYDSRSGEHTSELQ